MRPWVVGGLAALGLALIAPTILRVGLPFLAGDITGARAELAGLPVQVLRVSVPALALVLVLGTRGRASIATARRRRGAWLAVGLLVALDIILASRYLVAELLAVLLVGIGLAGWRIQPRRLAALALIAVLAFGGIQILRSYDQAAGRELAFAVERTINRVVLIQPRTLEALQAAIPAEQPYFGGLTWVRRLGPALGRPDIPNLGYWVYPRLFPGQEPPGYAAPGILGEAWANFGPARARCSSCCSGSWRNGSAPSSLDGAGRPSTSWPARCSSSSLRGPTPWASTGWRSSSSSSSPGGSLPRAGSP